MKTIKKEHHKRQYKPLKTLESQTEQLLLTKKANVAQKYFKNPNNYVTFFFCLPPPDFAGFDDGGGALSFFGACHCKTKAVNKKHKS